MAVTESMIVYFCMLSLFANAAITKDNTLFSMGDLCFVAVVLVINVKMQIIEMHSKSIVAGVSILLSIGAAFLWNIVLAAVYPPTSMYKARQGFFTGFGQNPTWWMTLLFIVVCVYLLEVSVGAFRRAVFPTDTDHFQELEKDLAYKERFEEAAGVAAAAVAAVVAVPDSRQPQNRKKKYTDSNDLIPHARKGKGSDIELEDLCRLNQN